MFCNFCWTGNSDATQRAIKVIDIVLTFASQFKIPCKKAAKDEKKADEEKKIFNNSEVIVFIVQSSLIKAKLHVFRSIRMSLETFLISL